MTYEEIYEQVLDLNKKDISAITKMAIINEVLYCFEDVPKEKQLELAVMVYEEYLNSKENYFDPIKFVNALGNASRDEDGMTRMDTFDHPKFMDFGYSEYHEI